MEQVETKEEKVGKPKLLYALHQHWVPSTKKFGVQEASMITEEVGSSIGKAIEKFYTIFPDGQPSSVQWNGNYIVVEGKRWETKGEVKNRLANEKRLRDFKKNNAVREEDKDMKEYERIKKKYNLG